MNNKLINISIAALALIGSISWIYLYNINVHTKDPPSPIVKEIVNPEIDILTRYQKKVNPNLPIEIAELQARLILKAAKEEKTAVELIVGIAQAESAFNPTATSSAGAAGLMQVLKSTKVVIDQSKKYDIAYNLKTGCDILKEKMEINKGDLSKSLADYSGGAKWYVEKIYSGFVSYRIYRDGTQ